MALAITAPVPPTHSGETDPALYYEQEVGAAFPDIVGTSATSGGSMKVTVSAPEDGVPTVSVFVTASTFAVTTAGKFVYTPDAAGLYTVTLHDVSAGTDVSIQIQVFDHS